MTIELEKALNEALVRLRERVLQQSYAPGQQLPDDVLLVAGYDACIACVNVYELALKTIAELPLAEQDNMNAANMRTIALRALKRIN